MLKNLYIPTSGSIFSSASALPLPFSTGSSTAATASASADGSTFSAFSGSSGASGLACSSSPEATTGVFSASSTIFSVTGVVSLC